MADLLIARIALTIAPRQIDADGIAEDMIERIGNGDVAATAADSDDQFDLELEVGREAADTAPRAPSSTTASRGFWKKNGGSRSSASFISRIWSR